MLINAIKNDSIKKKGDKNININILLNFNTNY